MPARAVDLVFRGHRAARDRHGAEIATGSGDSIAEALLCPTPPHH